MRATTRIVAAAASATLLLGPLAATATAGEGAATGPCSQRQAQVERAEAALERVTAVFERQQEKVAAAQGAVRSADKGSERGQAQRALAAAKRDRAQAKKAKKAQVQRLAKAEDRLAACQSAAPAAG